mmetsp:Transcript_129371/g.242052  ORF Transcript_129371/g.242052 Transcript_129371/m.242052 type:complete len:110 (-) Transcript_129371:91-420(-)
MSGMMDFDLNSIDTGDAPQTVSQKPPVGFSAAKSASKFNQDLFSMGQNHRNVADYAGPGGAAAGGGMGGGAGGGGEGPALPFRIKHVNLRPTPLGMDPVFSIAKMQGKD